MKLLNIEPKVAGKKPYLRAQAKPGGWVSIWEQADIDLVKAHMSAGEYEGQVVEEQNGQYTNRNLSGLTWSDAAPAPAAAPSTSGQAEQTSNGHRGGESATGWRTPEQIIRTDALRIAQEASLADGMHDEALIVGRAMAYERYITTGSYDPALSEQTKPTPTETSAANGGPAVDWLGRVNAAMTAGDAKAVYAEAYRTGGLSRDQLKALDIATRARVELIDRGTQ